MPLATSNDEEGMVRRVDPFKNGKRCTLLSKENRGRLGPSRSQAGWWVFDCTHGADVRDFYYPLFSVTVLYHDPEEQDLHRLTKVGMCVI